MSRNDERKKGVRKRAGVGDSITSKSRKPFATKEKAQRTKDTSEKSDVDTSVTLKEKKQLLQALQTEREAKKWELEAELRKVQIRIRAAEETAEMERKHRLELQARAQALGIALKQYCR